VVVPVSRPDPAAGGRLGLSLDVSAVPARPAGAGRYTLELAGALVERDDVWLTMVARRSDAERWRALAAVPGGPAPVVGPWAPDRRPSRLVWEQVGLPGRLRRAGVAVHHGPHYTMPERAPVPVVVTVHDCTFFDHPEWHERSKVLVFRRAIRVAARRAAVIVCVSRTTAERLDAVVRLSVPVVVAPHGVDHRRFAPSEPTPGADTRALAGLGLDPGRPLVTFVGTMEPRKGVADLVRAFDQIAGSHPEARLVLAGQTGWGADQVGPALARARHADRVVRTGYVPDEAVPALLRSSAVVVYPSLEEGYGLPALEALACGAPLVTTSGTAMEEVAGPAAILVPPARPDQLAEALDGALGPEVGSVGAARRRVLGLQIAAGRTWAASAERHVEAYRLARGR
jgi:glycosyltransferase involved in cell wall biosynthesis